jgi:hypothetical protein
LSETLRAERIWCGRDNRRRLAGRIHHVSSTIAMSATIEVELTVIAPS